MAKRKRPVDGEQRRYVWKLYPTREQEEVLREQCRLCADLWNALLDICLTRNQRGIQRRGKSISFHCSGCADASGVAGKLTMCEAHKLPSEYDMGYWITAMLAECPEWRAMSTWTPRRVAGSLAAAWQAFFRRAKEGRGRESGPPMFKSRRHHASIPHRCLSGCAVRKSNRHDKSYTVRLKGVPSEIWARGDLPAAVNEWNDADVMFHDGKWSISVAVAITPRRQSLGCELKPVTVKFNLLDGFAEVGGTIVIPDGFAQIAMLEERKRSMQADFDLAWPRGKRWSDEQWVERCEVKAEIGHLASRIARIRANTLHVWTKRLIERASSITVIKPTIKELTRSPRGDELVWGSQVETVSTLNRTALSYAPAMAVAMLEYKAKEIGIRCDVIEDDAAPIAVGRDLVKAGKMQRRIKRQAKKEM
jgi:hypothetical protein